MNTSEISAAHENSIKQLIGEFGKNYEEIVRATYNSQREAFEKQATVHYYVPILCWRATRDVLQKEGSLADTSKASS